MKNATIKKRLDEIVAKVDECADVDGLKKLRRHAINLRRLYLENEIEKDDFDNDLYSDICWTIKGIEDLIKG